MERIVTDIRKNLRERIRVELSEFNGHDLISLRIWADDGAQFIPTRKGIAVAVRHLPALRQALEDAERIARAEGLL